MIDHPGRDTKLIIGKIEGTVLLDTETISLDCEVRVSRETTGGSEFF